MPMLDGMREVQLSRLKDALRILKWCDAFDSAWDIVQAITPGHERGSQLYQRIRHDADDAKIECDLILLVKYIWSKTQYFGPYYSTQAGQF